LESEWHEAQAARILRRTVLASTREARIGGRIRDWVAWWSRRLW